VAGIVRSLPKTRGLVAVLTAFLLGSCQASVTSLLQQHRFDAAYERLVAAEAEDPEDWRIRRQLALALGGWLEFGEDGEPRVVVGLDRPVEAYQKYYGDQTGSVRALRSGLERFSLEWYRFIWEAHWFAKRAGEREDRYRDVAAKFFRIARSTDDFAHLKAKGEEGVEIFRCFEADVRPPEPR